MEKPDHVPIARLKQELLSLGVSTEGSRSELVSRCYQSGLYKINLNANALPPIIDTSSRYPNTSCVYIGNGAGKYNKDDNKLYIGNDKTDNLIHGDFVKQSINVNKIFNIESEDFDPTTVGNEGDMRRVNENLYMYRCTNCDAGWYKISFGNIKLL